MEAQERKNLKDKKRIVIKIGSSSLTHPETGELNLMKIEKLIRTLSDLRGQGKDVVLVSSGAIAAGRQALGHHKRPDSLAEKQAFAAVGQARLMMVYQKLCAEYNQTAAQVLLTKDTMVNDASRYNAQNTFEELLNLGTIPIVNENDTVSTSEIPYVDSPIGSILGWIPEWPKGADCKSVSNAFEGSNPSPSIKRFRHLSGSFFVIL